MPSVQLLPPRPGLDSNAVANPLPALLHTPSGMALLELQGSVLSEDESAGILRLGRLVFPPAEGQGIGGEWDGKRVYLFVGHHQRLTGEVKKLAKPVGLLRRRRIADSGVSADEEDVEIVDIAYHKILFSSRPEPVSADQQVLHDA